jgi:hypothetical protein
MGLPRGAVGPLRRRIHYLKGLTVNKRFRFLAIPLSLAAVGAANAAQDVTAVTGSITDIAAVGAAVFGVVVAIKLTKWVRRAL